MKYKLPVYIWLFALVLAFSACYKDEGNYDYVEVNTVSFGGIEDKYTVNQNSYLEILPQLGFTEQGAGDSARYTYEWFAMKVGALVADKRFPLGTNKNLRMTANMPAGAYNVYYRVKDQETGVQFTKSFDLEVVSPIYEGWLAMTEVNGKARLDMVNKLDGQYTVIPDVLNAVGSSLVLEGKPLAVRALRLNPLTTGYYIYLATDKTTNRVDAETFQYTSTLNIKYDMLTDVPDNFTVSDVTLSGGYRAYMLAGKDAYFYYYTYNIYFGLPVNVLKGEAIRFDIAPFIATASSGSTPDAFFYDTEHKRFVRHVGSESTTSLMPPGTLFDYETGMDMVYMAWSPFNNGNVFSILHDNATGKYYLARFTTGANIQQVYYEEMTATDMALAKNFAVSPDFGYIFYTVGGKLYSYDMSQKASKLMMEKSGQEFTLLQFRNANLMAASIDPSKPEGANGTLEEYAVPPVQGDLELQNSFSGMGKIVSIAYRAR